MKHTSRAMHPIIGVCIVLALTLLVGLAWLLARDAPSSAVGDINSVPRKSISAAQGCQNFVNYWLNESSVELDTATIEGFTNCREGTDGNWYIASDMPESLNPRPPIVAPENEAESNELRAQILSDIATFQQSLSTPMMRELGKVYSEQAKPVIGFTQEGVSLSSIRTRYARIMNGFMLDPQHEAMAEYVAWVMQQRIDAFGAFRRACLQDETAWLRQPCIGMEDNLSIRYTPWYWELANNALIDDYLHHVYGPVEEENEASRSLTEG